MNGVVIIVELIALSISLFVLGVGFYIVWILGKPVISKVVERIFRRIRILKKPESPILSPTRNPWETNAAFNPAALLINNQVHLLYRAIGEDGFSRIGYARSDDGFFFPMRLPYPVYVPREKDEGLNVRPPVTNWRQMHSLYPSGGGWGGCEDPRAVLIDGTVYMTYNAINGWGSMKVALTSISETDFLAGVWKWRRPAFISPGMRHKNWVFFPEKIGGKFAVLHSILCDGDTDVRIVFVDDPFDVASQQYEFESPDPQQFSHRPCAWHTRVRSAGPPPIKTSYGWLLLYHATDAEESHKYKLGAMLLDIDNPTKVIGRAPNPVLVPDRWYENEGKPGIVYACGAVVKDGILLVYYGGGDKVASVATTPLEEFARDVMHSTMHTLDKDSREVTA
jgi:predicted GH43/DUF377 family glycosyl hydrolase